VTAGPSGIRVSTRLYRTGSFDPVVTWTVLAPDVFAAVDSVAAHLRHGLGIPDVVLDGGAQRPLRELTTSSPAAYRTWIERAVIRDKWANVEDALAAHDSLPALDPSFALAHRSLAELRFCGRGDGDGAERARVEALRHEYRLPERQRYLLRAEYHRARDESGGGSSCCVRRRRSIPPARGPGSPPATRPSTPATSLRPWPRPNGWCGWCRATGAPGNTW
jgi:hypothetical protein